VHLGFLLPLGVDRHIPIRFLHQFSFFSWGLPICTGCCGGGSVVDHSGLEDIVSFSSQSLPYSRRSLSWDACSESVRVTLPLKDNSYVHDQGVPCPLTSMAEA